MKEDAIAAAPRHASLHRQSLVAWPGYHPGVGIDAFDRRVVGAIAKPLAHVAQDSSLIRAALDAGMGVVLPGQTWRNQLPLDHPKRAGAFKDLPVARRRLVLDPNQAPFRPEWAQRYAIHDLEGQLLAGATLVVTAAHVHEVEARDGRQNDLLLARLEADEFVASRRFHPAPGREGRREIYATIVVQGRHAADARTVAWLIKAYSSLENIDGYWIIGVNTHGSGRQLAGYARLALELERVTERPTTTSCVGDAHLALLASKVASTCAGLHGMRLKHPPDELPTGAGGDEDDAPGLAIYTYHPAVLGNAGVLGPEGDTVRTALFYNRPCHCGHHQPRVPPRGRAQIVQHNLAQLQRDARAFIRRGTHDAEAYLVNRVLVARRHRSLLGMSRLSPGFLAVPREAQKLRERREEADER